MRLLTDRVKNLWFPGKYFSIIYVLFMQISIISRPIPGFNAFIVLDVFVRLNR